MVCAGGGGTRCGAPLSAAAHRRVCVRVGVVTARRAPSAVTLCVLSQCDEMGGINN